MSFKSITIILQLATLGLAFVAVLNGIEARDNSFRLFLVYCAEIDNRNLLCQELVNSR